MLQKSFSRKLAKIVAHLKSTPKDNRISSIINWFRDYEIQRAVSLGQYTSIRTTQKYYAGAAKDFK